MGAVNLPLAGAPHLGFLKSCHLLPCTPLPTDSTPGPEIPEQNGRGLWELGPDAAPHTDGELRPPMLPQSEVLREGARESRDPSTGLQRAQGQASAQETGPPHLPTHPSSCPPHRGGAWLLGSPSAAGPREVSTHRATGSQCPRPSLWPRDPTPRGPRTVTVALMTVGPGAWGREWREHPCPGCMPGGGVETPGPSTPSTSVS